jgi:large subunit ribosomal protein L29
MKTIDLRKKSTEDLEKELLEIRKAQFSARIQISTQQSK